MIILCEKCGHPIDIDKDLSYTLVNNLTLERFVICKICKKWFFRVRPQITKQDFEKIFEELGIKFMRENP